MASDGDNKRLFRVRRTVLQMLGDRGYQVKDDEIKLSLYEFLQLYGDPVRRDEIVIHCEKKGDPNDKVPSPSCGGGAASFGFHGGVFFD